HRLRSEHRQMADDADPGRRRPRVHLPLRPEPRRAAMALAPGAAPSPRWLGSASRRSSRSTPATSGNFNKTYGSLGAVIGLMAWMWLSVAVLLIGGKLNAEMEHQTARDTTEGEPKPIGSRRAKMADTLGAARS